MDGLCLPPFPICVGWRLASPRVNLSTLHSTPLPLLAAVVPGADVASPPFAYFRSRLIDAVCGGRPHKGYAPPTVSRPRLTLFPYHMREEILVFGGESPGFESHHHDLFFRKKYAGRFLHGIERQTAIG